jgi:hypothetical protein
MAFHSFGRRPYLFSPITESGIEFDVGQSSLPEVDWNLKLLDGDLPILVLNIFPRRQVSTNILETRSNFDKETCPTQPLRISINGFGARQSSTAGAHNLATFATTFAPTR